MTYSPRTLPFSASERAFITAFIGFGDREVTLEDLVDMTWSCSTTSTRRAAVKRIHNFIARVNEKHPCISTLAAQTNGLGRQIKPHRWRILAHRISDEHLSGTTIAKRRRVGPLTSRILGALAAYPDTRLSTYDIADEIGLTGQEGPTPQQRRAVANALRHAGVASITIGREGGGYDRLYPARLDAAASRVRDGEQVS